MYKLKLTYFDIPGGRGEPTRLAMHIGGIEFEDFRFSFDKFAEVKETTPLKQVPTLFVDGKQITQCNGINRFVGKLAGLYPDDNYQALLCDEILEATEESTHRLVATFGLQGDELKRAREEFAAGPLTLYLRWAQARLEDQGGEYFVENRLTIADLKVFIWVRGLTSGNFDYIPATLVEEVAPKLLEHYKRVEQTPAIADYYSGNR